MIKGKQPELTNKNLDRARRMLFDVVDLLDKHGVVYHLEGGTLLGLVRNKDLLPWDHDVDLSLPFNNLNSFLKIRRTLFFKGYKLSIRKSHEDFGPIKKGDCSIIKVKPLFHYLFDIIYPKAKENLIILDVFMKTSDEKSTYWQAKGRVMRVDNKYYNSFELVDALDRSFKAPSLYKDYLTEKYGDWSVPVKEWNCRDNEKTICGDITSKAYPKQ